MASDKLLNGEKRVQCRRCGQAIRTKRDAHIRLDGFTLRQTDGKGRYLDRGYRSMYLCEEGGCAPTFARVLVGAEVADAHSGD